MTFPMPAILPTRRRGPGRPRRRRGRLPCSVMMSIVLVGGLLAGFGSGSPAGAQQVDFEPLLAAREVTVLLEFGDHVYGGLDGGGLAVWPTADPGRLSRWTAGGDLSGNSVTDIAWTGRNVWVAALGGGLTRITDIETAPAFRQYTSNLGSLDVTAVAGAVIGQSERVYYAMKDEGLGVITDGLSGNIYTAAQDGLIADRINALAVLGEDLFIATEIGVCRFRDNQFTDQVDGLTNLWIYDLVVDRQGLLWAGGKGGIYQWDPLGETWLYAGGIGGWVVDLADGPAGLFALGLGGGGNGVLGERVGSAWSLVTLPEIRCAAVASGSELWVGGRAVLAGMDSGVGIAYLGRRQAAGTFETWRISSSLVQNAEGVAFDTAGRAWIGSHTADAVSGLDGSEWSHIYELADAENDSSGLFNYGSNILAMAGDLDGAVWISQYTTGLVRHDPVTGISELVKLNDSGLSGAFLLDVVVHPAGPILFLHDIAWIEGTQYPEKVDVLLDGVHWRNPDNWLTLPLDVGGLSSDNRIWSALVERPDVVWFAAEDLGLVRWDINGALAGPQDELTWTDFGDDTWWEPVDAFFGSTNDPRKVKGLALAPDGTIWAGGNGVVRFRYNESTRLVTVLETYAEKTSPFSPGLLSVSVNDLATDRNGHLWVATTAGLNRIRSDADPVAVDVWTDLGNYLANPNYGLLYSPNVIAALPGGTYRDLATTADGSRILLSSDQGAVLATVATSAGGAQASLAGVYCYPNPFYPGQGQESLALAGGPLADAEPGSLKVEVYNLEGQLVLRDNAVTPEAGFWDGQNRVGEAAASGMYVVKVSWGDATAVLPLAVVR